MRSRTIIGRQIYQQAQIEATLRNLFGPSNSAQKLMLCTHMFLSNEIYMTVPFTYFILTPGIRRKNGLLDMPLNQPHLIWLLKQAKLEQQLIFQGKQENIPWRKKFLMNNRHKFLQLQDLVGYCRYCTLFTCFYFGSKFLLGFN